MTKAQKKKWIEALRSGEYKQGKQMLYRNGRYCCLGVGCVVLRDKETSEIAGRSYPSSLGLRGFDGLESPLSEINDSGVPFEVIAGVIDQWVETTD